MPSRIIFIVDTMLATGCSIISTVDLLKDRGCISIKALVLVAAHEGVATFEKAHHDIELYTASIYDCLNEQDNFLHGLGHAGEKIFGTK